tara:strand:- start:5213 stop:5638 length:426 start_codon:yes stop_codon:yes gene_type:complete
MAGRLVSGLLEAIIPKIEMGVEESSAKAVSAAAQATAEKEAEAAVAKLAAAAAKRGEKNAMLETIRSNPMKAFAAGTGALALISGIMGPSVKKPVDAAAKALGDIFGIHPAEIGKEIQLATEVVGSILVVYVGYKIYTIIS